MIPTAVWALATILMVYLVALLGLALYTALSIADLVRRAINIENDLNTLHAHQVTTCGRVVASSREILERINELANTQARTFLFVKGLEDRRRRSEHPRGFDGVKLYEAEPEQRGPG